MSELKLSFQQASIRFRKNGWSHRAIGRELGIDRGTVGRYLRLDAKPATEVPAGSPGGSRSRSAQWGTKISAKGQAGLSAQRIYQDLLAEDPFAASYDSVKRFIRVLARSQPLPFRRMECEPGPEVQVDFGKGAWVMVEGKRKRPHLFRVLLRHSRKGYSEVVWPQRTENFIRCLENAFRYFGGVAQTTVLDYVPRHIIRVMFPTPLCGGRG